MWVSLQPYFDFEAMLRQALSEYKSLRDGSEDQRRRQLLYLLHSSYADYYEYRALYRDLFEWMSEYDSFSRGSVDIWSFGCGCRMDYAAMIREAAESESFRETSFAYRGIDETSFAYLGIDEGNRWGDDLAVQLRDKDSNARRSAALFEDKADVVIFPKSILSLFRRSCWTAVLSMMRRMEGEVFYLAISRPSAARFRYMYSKSVPDYLKLHDAVLEVKYAVWSGGYATELVASASDHWYEPEGSMWRVTAEREKCDLWDERYPHRIVDVPPYPQDVIDELKSLEQPIVPVTECGYFAYEVYRCERRGK